MKTLLLSFALVVLLFSCGKSDQEISDEFHRKIRGDWYIPLKYNESPFLSDEYSFLSFEDSLVASNYEGYSQYIIQFDTLYTYHKGFSRRPGRNIKKYKIIYIGKNWMKLVLIKTKEQFQNSSDKFKDTLCLKKVHSKNSVKPTSVGFYIASTFGPIRPTYIEIKSNREINFFVGHDVESISKKGRLSHSEYDEIMRSINKLPFNSLKDRYETGASDQVEYALTVNYENKQKHIDSYGLDDTPVELQLLFTKLFLLPGKCQLSEYETPLTDVYFWKRNIRYHWDLPMELPPLKFSEPK